MTAHPVPQPVDPEDLTSGQARDLARHAAAHSWIVDCVREAAWSGEADLVDETVRLTRLHGDGLRYTIHMSFDAVDCDGGHAAFGWRLRSLDTRGRIIHTTRFSYAVHAVHAVIADLGVIDLRDVA